MAQQTADDEKRPEPPVYTPITGGQREIAGAKTALGIVRPGVSSHLAIEKQIRYAFEDYEPSPSTDRFGDIRLGAMYFHTEWFTPEQASETVKYFPEMPKVDFYPPAVAEQIAALPEDSLVTLGREEVPVVYVLTNRPPLVGILKDTGNSGVVVEVVEGFPHMGDGECALTFDGRPGGEWHLVRASWLRY